MVPLLPALGERKLNVGAPILRHSVHLAAVAAVGADAVPTFFLGHDRLLRLSKASVARGVRVASPEVDKKTPPRRRGLEFKKRLALSLVLKICRRSLHQKTQTWKCGRGWCSPSLF